MSIDFERELSELLHTLTPEPPDHLAAPRVATLTDGNAAGPHSNVVELVAAADEAPSRRRRWSLVAAAAAVAALAGGVLGLAQVGGGTRRTPGPQPGTHAVSPTTATGALPRCRADQLVLSQAGPDLFVAHGHTGTTRLTARNNGATSCAWVLPTVSIGTGTTGGTAFPADIRPVSILGHAQLVITADVRITGRCRTVARGLRINMIEGPFTYSAWLGVTGCTLTPLRLTHRVAG